MIPPVVIPAATGTRAIFISGKRAVERVVVGWNVFSNFRAHPIVMAMGDAPDLPSAVIYDNIGGVEKLNSQKTWFSREDFYRALGLDPFGPDPFENRSPYEDMMPK